MEPPVRVSTTLARAGKLYPDLAPLLSPMNEAIRRINFGQMDILPYPEAVPGYSLYMRAELIPDGAGRPPQVGHWQIEMAREGHPYVLYLQGKHRGEEETGEMEFRCGPTAESRELSEPEP